MVSSYRSVWSPETLPSAGIPYRLSQAAARNQLQGTRSRAFRRTRGERLVPASVAICKRPLEEILARCCSGLCRRAFFEQLLFAVHQRVDVVRRQLKSVSVRDGIGRESFDTIATENTAGIVDVVDAGVALACRNSIRVGVFRGLNVDAIRRTSRRAKKATHALFQTI